MSMTEIVMILVIVLVVLGPEKIPEVAKFAGKAIREVRKASNLLRDAVLIEDFTASPTPRKPLDTVDSVDQSLDYEDLFDPYRAQPTPERNVRMVALAPRADSVAITEVEIPFVSSTEFNREVYLHVPYEETV